MRPLWINHELGIGDGSLVLASTGIPSGRFRQLHAIRADGPDKPALRRALDAALASAPAQMLPLPRLTAYLGAPWVRTLILPWQNGLYKDSELAAYARVMMEKRFGPFRAPVRFRVLTSGFARPLFAAAMPQALHDALTASCAVAGFRLRAVSPLLAAAWNRYSLRFPLSMSAPAYLFVLLEHGYATCLFVEHGAWAGVITLPHAAGTSLGGLLNQAAVLCDLKLPDAIYVCGSGETVPAAALPAGLSCKWLGSVKSRLWQASDATAVSTTPDTTTEGFRHACDPF